MFSRVHIILRKCLLQGYAQSVLVVLTLKSLCASVAIILQCICQGKNSINTKSVRKNKRIAMQSKKALESACETTLRQYKDRERKAQKRACETLQRQQLKQARMTIKRASENECETLQRQQLNQARMTKKRALETYDEKMQQPHLRKEPCAFL